jgi:hypothetical protein
MVRWGRWGKATLVVGLVAALAGCGQLFAQAPGTPSLTELANRVDSLDAQVGELQAAIANLGSGATPPAATSGAGGQATAVVQADVLNVRSEPSLDGTVVGTLLQNTQVTVLGEQGNWDEISYTNPQTGVHLQGWVDADYLGPIAEATGPSGSPASSGTAAGAPSSSTTTASAGAAGASGSGASPSATSASGSY